jgi:hypothetical protein
MVYMIYDYGNREGCYWTGNGYSDDWRDGMPFGSVEEAEVALSCIHPPSMTVEVVTIFSPGAGGQDGQQGKRKSR